jgi:type 1 glutamine amidotransferase
MIRNLILAGGIGHPFEQAAPALQTILADERLESEVNFDVEAGMRSLAATRYDIVTVYALRWRMLGSEKYAPHRARWAFSPSQEARAALQGHLGRGGGLLALHTAIICFDDWDEWSDILGARWVWGQSSHPPRGGLKTRMADARSPLTKGLDGFSLANDEVYGGLEWRDKIQPLMTAQSDGHANEAPVLWTRTHGPAHVAVDLLGHDADSLEQPVHRTILTRAAQWCAAGARS